jgi:hypothetical protein
MRKPTKPIFVFAQFISLHHGVKQHSAIYRHIYSHTLLLLKDRWLYASPLHCKTGNESYEADLNICANPVHRSR